MGQRVKNICKIYPNAQGIIFVIGILDAAGTNVDIDNVSSTFKGLGFAVFQAIDYTCSDIACLLHIVATIKSLPLNYEYIAFYYAGCGGSDEYGRSFIAPMKETNTPEILFIEENILSSFKNASKSRRQYLFFFDCCLNSLTHSSISTLPHPPAKVRPPIHSLVAYATSVGYASLVDQDRGGFWTHILCEKLKEPLSLSDILDQTYDVVSARVKDDRRQLPCYESNLGAVYLKGNLIVYTINLLFGVSFN